MIQRLGPFSLTGASEGKEQRDFDVLRPKGPEPLMVKQFNLFLRLLAKSMGVSEQYLRKRGYRCEAQGNQVRLAIPNADHHKAFKAMLKSGLAPTFKMRPAEAAQHAQLRQEIRPSLRLSPRP
jgi:hypothetical protein